MARSTLANHPDFVRRSLPKALQLFAQASESKLESKFRVFPTTEAECPWRIVALTSNQTISRHKSLTYALRKCARLNEQHKPTKLDPLTIALSGFRDVNSYRAYYEGVANDSK